MITLPTLKNIRKSVITRLMVYFLIASIILVALFAFNIAFGLKVHFKNEILPNIAQYIIYIKDDIGTPPNLQKAKQLSEKLSIKVKIIGPDLQWQSGRFTKKFDHLEFESAPEPYQEFQLAHHKHHNFVLLQDNEYSYYFSVGRLARSPSSKRNMALIAIFVLFMLVLFFALRHSLKPIQEISKGVKKISEGDLNSTITIKNSYEFEQLANGINTMSAEINTMLEAKQQLLLAISHELRSPITRAQVNLALIPDSESQQALKHDLKEMELLISQILESQRLNQTHAALTKTHFSLDTLIHEIIDTYFPNDPINCQLSTIELNADKTRLTLLIKNLIDNAIKYSRHSEQAPVVELTQNNKEIILKVTDFGIGINETDLNKITDAFYRVDQARQRSTGGFGLGLYLAHLIAKAHNAKLTFTSEVNKGTTAILKIPI